LNCVFVALSLLVIPSWSAVPRNKKRGKSLCSMILPIFDWVLNSVFYEAVGFIINIKEVAL
jgi:hypothetical protein